MRVGLMEQTKSRLQYRFDTPLRILFAGGGAATYLRTMSLLLLS